MKQMLTFKNKTFDNWKDYFGYKFFDVSKFYVEQFDIENESMVSYRVSSMDVNCKTEIIFKILADVEFKFLFDLYFSHPDSPIWKEENERNEYGWDGQGCHFTIDNLTSIDDWINIPLFNGWTESSFYFDGVYIRTDAIWFPHYKPIPIRQNFINNYGCLLFPIVILQTYYKSWYWKRHPEKSKEVKNIIQPMFLESEI